VDPHAEYDLAVIENREKRYTGTKPLMAVGEVSLR
jgi:hypothetical protein